MTAAERSLKLISFYLPSLAGGGAEKNCIILAEQFLQRGIAVDFVLNHLEGDLLPQVPKGAHIEAFGCGTAKAVPKLIDYLRRRRPDALFSNLATQNVAAVIAGLASRTSTRIIPTQHNALSQQSKKTTWQQRLTPILYRYLMRHAHRVVAVSQGVAEDLISVAAIPTDKIAVITNPAYPTDLAVKLTESVAEPFFETSEPIILGVGRLVPQKDFATLIRAFAIVLKTRPARLAILGVGPLEQSLLEIARSEGVADSIKLLGFSNNPLKFMNRADIVAMSSEFEGFGNVLVEAMACGTPVVSTNCNFGPSEILDGGAFGKLVAVGDFEALSQAILATLDDSVPAETLQARAREFSADRAAQHYLLAASR